MVCLLVEGMLEDHRNLSVANGRTHILVKIPHHDAGVVSLDAGFVFGEVEAIEVEAS